MFAVAAAAEEDDFIGNDVGGVDFFAVFVVVTAGLQAAFDIDLLALGQVVGELVLTPDSDVGPVGFFLEFVGCLVFPAVNFVSASRPRFPIRSTLLTLREAIFSRKYHTKLFFMVQGDDDGRLQGECQFRFRWNIHLLSMRGELETSARAAARQ